MRDYNCFKSEQSEVREVLYDQFRKIYDKGYSHGFIAGKVAAYQNPECVSDQYTKGLEDAWTIARRIMLDEHEEFDGKECLSSVDLKEVFGIVDEYDVLRRVPIHQAKEKLVEWDEGKYDHSIIGIGTIVIVKNCMHSSSGRSESRKGIITRYDSTSEMYGVLDVSGDVVWRYRYEFDPTDKKCDMAILLSSLIGDDDNSEDE